MASEKKIDPHSYEDLSKVVAAINAQVKSQIQPTIGIICGSGLGDIGDLVEMPQIVPYSKIPGFPVANVVGHKGNLIFGYIKNKYVICAQGRFHPYEHGMDLTLCAMPVRIMHMLGVQTLIVSNAAGGVNANYKFGDLMLIKDHIFVPGLAGFSPLVGPNNPHFGARFPSVHNAYDKKLRTLAKQVAAKQHIRLHEGIYVMTGGPQYETPTEVRMFKTLGGDALGMSTCHEVTVAAQCNVHVLGLSLITNVANLDADTAVEVKHEDVLKIAKEGSERACKFVSEIIASI